MKKFFKEWREFIKEEREWPQISGKSLKHYLKDPEVEGPWANIRAPYEKRKKRQAAEKEILSKVDKPQKFMTGALGIFGLADRRWGQEGRQAIADVMKRFIGSIGGRARFQEFINDVEVHIDEYGTRKYYTNRDFMEDVNDTILSLHIDFNEISLGLFKKMMLKTLLNMYDSRSLKMKTSKYRKTEAEPSVATTAVKKK